MVDKFFVQYRQWLTIFLCNGVMLLLLLLNIVNIVVLKKQLALYFLVLTTIQTMVDKFFVQYRQWLTIFLCNGVMLLLLLLNIVNIVVLKTTGFIFLVLTTIQTMVDNFLCNGVMLLLLLLNIVNIVVLKNNGLYIFSFNDNTDNGRQFFVQWSNDAFIIVDYCR